MMDVFISDLQEKKQVDIETLQHIALQILSELHCDEHCELSIALVDDQEIHRLNREYRGIDRSTDVLSFALQEAEEPVLVQSDSEIVFHPVILGDVILSTETTQRQATEHGHTFERELYFLLIHGVLHLLGYDHLTDEEAQIMEHLEQQLLHSLNF